MNLTIAIMEFGLRFYGGSELSKHLSTRLLRMWKMQKIEPDPIFHDGRKLNKKLHEQETKCF